MIKVLLVPLLTALASATTAYAGGGVFGCDSLETDLLFTCTASEVTLTQADITNSEVEAWKAKYLKKGHKFYFMGCQEKDRWRGDKDVIYEGYIERPGEGSLVVRIEQDSEIKLYPRAMGDKTMIQLFETSFAYPSPGAIHLVYDRDKNVIQVKQVSLSSPNIEGREVEKIGQIACTN